MAKTHYNGNEAFTYAGVPERFTLRDFWRWHNDSFMSNITLGHLAEFILAHALGIAESGPLEEWQSHDLEFENRRI